MFFTPYIKSMDFTVCLPFSTSLIFPRFVQEEECLDWLAVFYRYHISSISKNTKPLDGPQPFDLTIDLKYLPIAGLRNCNYNLAII